MAKKKVKEEMEEDVIVHSAPIEDTEPPQDDNPELVYLDARHLMKDMSTKIELRARYLKENKIDEELERLGIEQNQEKEFEFDYFVIDLRDVHGFNRVTDGNTFIRMNDGGTVWYVDYDYDKFKIVYEKLLNYKIYTPDEVIQDK